MSEIDENSIRDALRKVIDPALGKDIVALGQVSGIVVQTGQVGAGQAGAQVTFVLEVDPARGPQLEELRQQAEQAVRRISGVARVTAVLTAHRPAPTAEDLLAAASYLLAQDRVEAGLRQVARDFPQELEQAEITDLLRSSGLASLA